MERLRNNHLNKENLLQSAKTSKRSLECKFPLYLASNNVNLKAAMIHIIGDIIQSVGVIIASILIYFFPDYHILDPLITIMFSVIVVVTTVPIVKECIITIMEAKPEEFNYEELRNIVSSIQGVKEIKCIHIFCLSTDKLVIQLKVVSDEEDVLSLIREAVLKDFDCFHLNVEVQKSNIDYYENQRFMNV
jgi:zinc transporter 2